MPKQDKKAARKWYVHLLTGTFLLVLLISLLWLLTFFFTDALTPGSGDGSDLEGSVPSEGDDPVTDSGNWLFSDVDLSDALNLSSYEKLQLPSVYPQEYALYPGRFSDDRVDFMSERDFVIVLDPGHQDSTHADDIWLSPYLNPSDRNSWVYGNLAKMGTTGVATGVPEYEVTHAVAKLLKAELEKRGYTVYLTKDSVKTIMTGPERAKISNLYNADLTISLHCDGYAGDSSVSGALVQVPEVWEGYPDVLLSYLSHLAGASVLSSYCEATGMRQRGIQEISQSSAFSWCKTPSILLEMGYMTNASDDRKLNDDAFREKMVQGIANGIDDYCRIMQATQMVREAK